MVKQHVVLKLERRVNFETYYLKETLYFGMDITLVVLNYTGIKTCEKIVIHTLYLRLRILKRACKKTLQ